MKRVRDMPTEKVKKKTHGGARKNSGRVKLNFRLNEETAKMLRLLTQYLKMTEPDIEYTPDSVLDILIYQAVHRTLIEKVEEEMPIEV